MVRSKTKAKKKSFDFRLTSVAQKRLCYYLLKSRITFFNQDLPNMKSLVACCKVINFSTKSNRPKFKLHIFKRTLFAEVHNFKTVNGLNPGVRKL